MPGSPTPSPRRSQTHARRIRAHTWRLKRAWGIVKLTGDIWPSDWEYKKSDIMEAAVKAANGTEPVAHQEGFWVTEPRPGRFGGQLRPGDDITSWQEV